MIKREIRAAVWNRYVFGGCLCMCLSCIQIVYPYTLVLNSGGLMNALRGLLESPIVGKTFPREVLLIFCAALPVMWMARELAENSYRNYVFRMGMKRYICARLLGAVFAAFSCTVLAEGIFLLMYLAAKPRQLYLIGPFENETSVLYGKTFGVQLLYFLMQLNLAGLYTGMWSSITLAVAAWTNNNYVILGAACVTEKLLDMISCWGWFPLDIDPIFFCDGTHWIAERYPFEVYFVVCVLYDGVIIAAAWKLFSAGVRRRAANG